MGIKNGNLKYVVEGLSEIMVLDLKPTFAYKLLLSLQTARQSL